MPRFTYGLDHGWQRPAAVLQWWDQLWLSWYCNLTGCALKNGLHIRSAPKYEHTKGQKQVMGNHFVSFYDRFYFIRKEQPGGVCIWVWLLRHMKVEQEHDDWVINNQWFERTKSILPFVEFRETERSKDFKIRVNRLCRLYITQAAQSVRHCNWDRN